jgi:hypothetical protein
MNRNFFLLTAICLSGAVVAPAQNKPFFDEAFPKGTIFHQMNL